MRKEGVVREVNRASMSVRVEVWSNGDKCVRYIKSR